MGACSSTRGAPPSLDSAHRAGSRAIGLSTWFTPEFVVFLTAWWSVVSCWMDGPMSMDFRSGTFSGPPFGVDEVQRVRSRIKGEQKQLPADVANIVVIEGFNAMLDGRPIEYIVSDIAETLYDAGHVFAAVISGGYIGDGVYEATMYGQHRHVRRRRFDVLIEEHLVLVSRFCDAPVSPAVLSDLYRAYLQS
jgi:hypothetical protein